MVKLPGQLVEINLKLLVLLRPPSLLVGRLKLIKTLINRPDFLMKDYFVTLHFAQASSLF